MPVRIKDLPVLDRPRERLINIGVENLSDEELLSVIINTGTSKLSSKELSLELLKRIKKINNLKSITLKELLDIKGIGYSKAASLLASIELGKRIYNSTQSIIREKFNNPKLIYEYYKNKLININQEHFYAIYLDASKKIIEEKLLFIGTANKSLVHPRDVFKYACILNASGIICVHNHPSGNVLPSKEDLNITSKLCDIGVLFNIPIIDHIIIGDTKYYSFFENGEI